MFNADATIQSLGSNLTVSNSTLTVASSRSFSVPTLDIYQSTVTGEGNGALTVTGTMSWQGGPSPASAASPLRRQRQI